MLVFVELGADFSRGCARPAMQPPISATHPHRLAIRELTPANDQLRKGEWGRYYIICCVRSIRYMTLRHKLVYVVVEAVV
jgi:hypothetical protein